MLLVGRYVFQNVRRIFVIPINVGLLWMNSLFIRLYNIIEESIVDGPGIRYVLFSQGCSHGCVGCHNPQSHAFNEGTLVEVDWIFSDVKKNPLINGITFSGGEPFHQSIALATLAKMCKEVGYHLLCYTGFMFEYLLTQKHYIDFLEQLDIIIDGPFILEEKSLLLRFRGSRNQRVIDVPSSLSQGKTMVCSW